MMRRLIVTFLALMGVCMVATMVALMVDPGAGTGVDGEPSGRGMAFDVALFDTVALLIAGDPATIPLHRVHPLTRILLTGIILSGALLVALLFGAITDQILALRLEYLLGKRGVPRMENHIILVGLGQVGWRVFENLQQFQLPVLVIESNQDARFVSRARETGATVIIDDARRDEILLNASVGTARAIICATDDDLINLEVALDAREHNPDIRVVLRMYEQTLAQKVGQGFDIQVALSSSALAAPAFACAAIDRSIVNSFFLDTVQVVTLRVVVGEGAEMTKMTRHQVEQTYPSSLLKHKPVDGDPVVHPREDAPIQVGDVLLLNCTLDQIQPLKAAANYTYS